MRTPIWLTAVAALFSATTAHASVLSLSAQRTTVTGGYPVTATVRVNPCPHNCEQGAEEFELVTLSSSDSTVATVSPYVYVDRSFPGKEDFAVVTHPVGSRRYVTITAASGTSSRTLTLTVDPPPTGVVSLTLDKTNVYAYERVHATVTLDHPAPPIGWSVQVNIFPGAASAASPVTVMDGQTSATFEVNTSQVPSLTTVTITAGGKSATLTVLPEAVNLKIRKLEFTDAIQYLDDLAHPDNSIPLFKGRPLAVRVHLLVEGTGRVIYDVKVSLATRPTGSSGPWHTHAPVWPTPTAQVMPGTDAATLQANRDSHASNMSFIVDEEELATGQVDFKAEVNPLVFMPCGLAAAGIAGTPAIPLCHKRLIAETSYDDNVWQETRAFHATKDLKIKFFRLDYWPLAPTPFTPRHKPSWDSRFPIVDYLEKVYPVDSVSSTIGADLPCTLLQANTAILIPPCPFEFKAQWEWGFLLDYMLAPLWWLTGAPHDVHYYLLVSNKVPHTILGFGGVDDYNRCCAAGIANDPGTAAEEVGHNLGRRHAPCGNPDYNDSNWPDATNPVAIIGQTGFNVGANTAGGESPILDHKAYTDFMGYCPTQWVSPYTYCGLYGNFALEGGSCPGLWPTTLPPDLSGRQFPAAGTPPSRYLLVSGWVDEEGHAVFGSFHDRAFPAGSHDQPGTGPYSIVLRGRGGSPLFERALELHGHQSRESGGHESGSFFEIVPFPAGTAEIALRRAHEGKTLATRLVSAHPPVVRMTYPNGKERIPAGKPVNVAWQASDADRDRLTYTLLYSRDAGVSWEPITAGVFATHYEVDPAALAGTAQGLFRIIASDGVRTAQDDSDATFVVESQPPEVFVLAPTDGTKVPAGAPLRLRGIGSDPEDGRLSDRALTWTSDRDGPLGSGRQVAVRLSPGVHALTLTGRDAEGKTAAVTIHVEATPP